MRWYLGAQNDGLFIIDQPPRPSTDDYQHESPNNPDMIISVGQLTREKAQQIIDAHNAAVDGIRTRESGSSK